MVGGRCDLASELGRQAMDRLDAVRHHVRDRAGLERQVIEIAGERMLDGHRACGQIAHAHQPPAHIHDLGFATTLGKSIPREGIMSSKMALAVSGSALLRPRSLKVVRCWAVFLLLLGHGAAHQVSFA